VRIFFACPVERLDRRVVFCATSISERSALFTASSLGNASATSGLRTTILNALMEQKEYAPYEKILGIVDHDLFVPELNFVFGEASPKAVVISLTRLRQTFYHLPENQNLFHQRVLTEAVHELGHTYGLGHCGNPRCVMFFSNSLMDTDRKGSGFCPSCKNKLQKFSPHHP